MKNLYSIVVVLFLFFTFETKAQQTVIIGTGSSVSAISPHNHATAYSVTEILYLQSEINTSGVITSLAFEKSDGTNLDSIQNVQIFLTYTNATSYTASVFDTAGAGYVEVYNGSFPNNALSGWMEVQLQNLFMYDNTQNLQVLFLKTNSPTIGVTGERARYRYSTPGGNRVRRYNSDNPYQIGVTNLTTTNFTSNIKLTIAQPAPPDCPMLATPPDNALQVCPSNPSFQWSTPTTGILPSGFEIYLGTDGGGSALPTDVLNGVSTGLVNNYNYQGTLSANTTYYWSVVSLNTFGSATGCQIYSFTTGNDAPSVSITAVPDPLSCFGDSANVTINVTGGTTPYTYLWNTGDTTAGVVLSAGIYSVTITDSINCEIQQTLVINQPPAIAANTVSTPDTTGGAACSGTVNANPAGGTPPYTVNWNSGSTSGLCTGWYTVTITDDNGCTLTDSVFVDFISALHELSNELVLIYPNPANEFIFISVLENEIGEIKIYTISGELVREKFINAKEAKLNVEELSTGVYFIEMQNMRYKFIKK